jgi:uncharacterized membrane protein HdeD (DUF308 family)
MTLPHDINELQARMREAMRTHWKVFLFEGILLAVMGLAALILPQLAGLAVTFWAREMPGFWWSLFSAALAVLAGLLLLARPMQGVLTLTIVVGAYFLAEGVATILYALEHRRELSERWSWLLIGGAMDIVISGLIVAGLPGSAEWAIGLLAGLNLMFGGSTLIGMALAARKP